MNIFVIAGEPSGDAQGALLVEALKSEWADLKFWGTTGPHLKKAGVQTLIDIDELSVMGLTEVIPKYIQISKSYKKIIDEIKIKKPSAIILIDYPGFNLRLLKDAYNLGITTIYHIPPKAWSHGESRTNILKKYSYLVTSILPFEVDFFKSKNVKIKFIGNPLKDSIDEFIQTNPVQKDPLKIAILPGSRQNEIKKLLPILIEAFVELEKIQNNLCAYIPVALNVSKPFFHNLLDSILQKYHKSESWIQSKIQIGYGNAYDVLNVCDYAWVCSGTATLETAFFETPMSVMYKLSPITYFFAKLLVKVKYASLVNLCTNHETIPEYLQEKATSQNLVNHALFILNNQSAKNKMIEELKEIKSLFPPNAAKNAAREIKKCILEYNRAEAEKFHLHEKFK